MLHAELPETESEPESAPEPTAADEPEALDGDGGGKKKIGSKVTSAPTNMKGEGRTIP